MSPAADNGRIFIIVGILRIASCHPTHPLRSIYSSNQHYASCPVPVTSSILPFEPLTDKVKRERIWGMKNKLH